MELLNKATTVAQFGDKKFEMNGYCFKKVITSYSEKHVEARG